MDFVVVFCPLCCYRLGKDSSNPGNVSQVCRNCNYLASTGCHVMPSLHPDNPGQTSIKAVQFLRASLSFHSPGDQERNPHLLHAACKLGQDWVWHLENLLEWRIAGDSVLDCV